MQKKQKQELNPINRFRTTLIRPTLENALKTTFYKKIWSGINIASIDLNNLEKLPLTFRKDIHAAGSDAQILDGVIAEEFFTGGTTTTPFMFTRSTAEQKLLISFLKSVHRRRNGQKLLRSIYIVNPYVVRYLDISLPLRKHYINIYQKGSFAYGRQVLRKIWDEPGVESRCSILMAIERLHRAFLENCQLENPAGCSNKLRVIYTTGHYLTRAIRENLQSYWGCPVVDCYGLSEVVGGAKYCRDCGWYHFDPLIVPEVIGSHSLKTIREGIGTLVLTALYPFQQAQPLVKYFTGDVVKVTHSSSCKSEELSIKPLGRDFCGLPAPNGDEWFLTPAQIFEYIDLMPEISRTALFRDSSQVSEDNRLGHPKYRIDTVYSNGEIPNAVIRINLKKEHTPDQWLSFENRIKREFIYQSSKLAERIASGSFNFKVKVENKLQPQIISYSP